MKEARKEYFKRYSYNFTAEGTCNLSEVFKQMAESTDLLGTIIHEIQVVWMGLDELRQANYALRSLPKGLKFLHVVPPSESPKVIGLVGMHDLDTLCHFNGLTHCPWCGKEGQNKGCCATNVTTAHQPHQTLSATTAGRTVSSQGRETPMNWFHQSSYQQETGKIMGI